VKSLLIPVLIAAVDQITKIIVRMTMKLGESIPLIGDYIKLTYIQNPGIAFGIHVGHRTLFTLLSVAVSFGIACYLYINRKQPVFYRLPLIFILGGAFGNLIDRILFGRVVDFIDVDIPDILISSHQFLFFNIPSFELYRWPVFNVADICVTIGMIILIFILLFSRKEVEGNISGESGN